MANIDDRVVSASFESTKFISGVSSTLSSLDKLNAALKKVGIDNGLDNIEKSASKITFGGLSSAIDKIKAKFGRGIPEADQAFSDVEKGSAKVGFTPLISAIDKLKGKFSFNREADQAFAEIEKSSGRVTFTGLGQALDNIGSKFSVLEGAASVALGNIASKAAMAGGSFAKSFTLGPIIDGFHEYETNLNSIQTILANTQASGAKLKDVQGALNDLNHYADKTIYNFSEMAKNIGTFTAAGVDLKTSTEAIKGIANLAAVSGSNSQQASTAMYQLSQAISSGRVSLQDWNSVVNAGMGGTVFQRALAQTAEKMGTLKDGAVALKGPMKNVSIDGKSFRESITAKPGEQSWLTSDVLTRTLSQFTGDLSDADLAAQGFNKSQIEAIQAQAKTAQKAATQVKTLSALLDTTKEAIGSGWTTTWQTIFGDFKEAPKLFTGISTALSGWVSDSANSRNKILKDWKDLGGRTALIEAIKNVFHDLGSVLKPIHDAFREIFPRETGAQLADLTKRFEAFTAKLKLGPETAAGLKSTFKGFFAVLDIGKQIIGGVFTLLGHLFGAIGDGSGGILNLTGGVGELIVKLDEWLKRGAKIHAFFAGLGDVLSVPLRLIGTLTGKLNGLFSGNVGGGITSSLSGVGSALKPAAKSADAASAAWRAFLKVVDHAKEALAPVGNAIADTFGNLGGAITDALKNNNWDGVFNVLQTGLIAGIFLTLKKALGGGLKLDIGGGVLKNVSSSLGVLRGSLVDIQKNVQAHTLLLIAGAVGVLTASIVALSIIKPDKIASSMAAISVGLAQLMVAMAILNKASGSAGIVKAPVMAASLILLAGALDVLSIAVLALSQLSWSELARGLAGVVGLLTAVSIATIPLSKGGPGMIAAGAGLIAVGVALNILAGAVKIFSTMSWEDLGKGLAAVAVSLVAVGLAMQTMPLTLPITGAGLILVAAGIGALSGAVKIFGSMNLGTLAKGIGAIAVSLVAIALAMDLMPLTLPLTAAGLVLVGVALTTISGAIAILGHQSIGSLAKGIGALAGALAVLAGGLTLMIAALPGAAALLVAAGALAVFVPVLIVMGKLNWGTIAKGLAAIALSLGVISVVGAVAAPGLLALGLAMTAFGVAVIAVGTGVYLLAKGLSLLSGNGAKGIAVFIAAMTAMILALPKMIIDFLKGLVQVVTGIAALAPQVVAATVKIAESLLTGLIAIAPEFAVAATALITAFLQVLAKNAGPMIQAGWKLLLQLLGGINDHIGQVTTTVANIVTKFLNALASKAGQLTAAGANVLAKFLAGIANNLAKVVAAGANVVVKYIESIVSNLGKVVTAGASFIIKLVSGITNNAERVAAAGATAILKFAAGIASNIHRVAEQGVTLVIRLIAAISKESLRMADEGAKAIIRFMNGVAQVIRSREPEMIAAGANIGKAIIQGMIQGLGDLSGTLKNKIEGIAGSIPSWAKKHLGIKSPSTVFHEIGGFVVEGLANGISENSSGITAAEMLSNNVLAKFREVFQITSPSKVMHEIGQYVGEGFAQGLAGSKDDIDSAFSDLNNKITDAMTTLQSTIATENAHLKELRSARKPDEDAIAKAKDALEANKKALDELSNAHGYLSTALAKQQTELDGHLITLRDLAGKMTDITTQIDAANSALQDAIKTRDDAQKSFAGQYSALPDVVTTDANGNPIDPSTQVQNFTQGIADQATAVAAYGNTLEQLRKLGLDDATYQKLLSDGTVDQQFASQLLSGGRTAVAGLNALDAQLQSASQGLGTNAANNLYQAGVDAADGLVKGLNSRQNDIRKAMEKIATAMIKAIRKKLDIKSPSREFAKVGEFSALGLARGFQSSSKAVVDAASVIGDNALAAMRDSMSHISDTLTSEIDTSPTITPVLDLTQVQKDAKTLSGMTNVVPITAAASYGLAASVNTSQAGSADDASAGGKTITFEQNNYSPKALSETEIYRLTNNQLSQVKSALGQ